MSSPLEQPAVVTVPQLLSVATVATVLEDEFVRQRTIRLAHFSLLSSCRHLRNSNPSPLRRRRPPSDKRPRICQYPLTLPRPLGILSL